MKKIKAVLASKSITSSERDNLEELFFMARRLNRQVNALVTAIGLTLEDEDFVVGDNVYDDDGDFDAILKKLDIEVEETE